MPSTYCDKALVPHLLSQLETLNGPFLQGTEIDSPNQPEWNDPLYQETETTSDPEGPAIFHVETDIDEISQNAFAVTTDENTASPHHVTPHSVNPTSVVDASQDQHSDTSIGQDPTPAAQNGSPLTTKRHSLNVLGLSSADMANLHQNDTLIRDIYFFYLRDGTLPGLQKVVRKILLQNSDFLFIDNVLFHSRVAKAKRTKTWINST